MPLKEFDTFGEYWQSYKENCIHPQASQEQIKAIKTAFYGGAIALRVITTRIMDNAKDDPDKLIEEYVKVSNELSKFVAEQKLKSILSEMQTPDGESLH